MVKKYGTVAWVGFGLMLALGSVTYGVQWRRENISQTRSYEAGLRIAEHAESIDDPKRALKVWQDVVSPLNKVKPGHSNYKDAQALIAKSKQEFLALQSQVEAKEQVDTESAVEAYNLFLKAFDPDGVTVESISIDPDIDTRLIVNVGSSWAIASKTSKLDLADSLWKEWGEICNCSIPRIKFKSKTGRDLGGTGTFATAIELRD